MSLIPGLGMARGMALTLRRFFEPKVTIKYPEVANDQSPRFRGRLQLLHDEWGTLKCETCFQCAQACPVECIDMGGTDTKGRYHVHWGAAETYGERREESALRRSGRTVPDRAYDRFAPVDPDAVDAVLTRHDHDPREMLQILDETQAAYGYLPVAALKRISGSTGAWYAPLYGIASSYRQLRFDPAVEAVAVCRCTGCLMAGAGRLVAELERGLGTQLGQVAGPDGVRLEQLPGHRRGSVSPLVVVAGQPATVSPDGAFEWARGLVAGRAGSHGPA